MKKLKLAVLIGATILSGSAMAATQGKLATGDNKSISSEGSLDVTLDIEYVIQVNKLDDIDLGTFKADLSTDLVGTDSFCVFTNAPSFNVTFTGGNTAGFEMVENNNNSLKIKYDVEVATIDSGKNISQYKKVAHNSTLDNINETRNRQNCDMTKSDGSLNYLPNLELKVTVEKDTVLDAIPGSYKDTITVLASPE